MTSLPLTLIAILLACGVTHAAEPRTRVSIAGEAFHINEQPTYAGRSWNGKRIEGLLFNSRMVQEETWHNSGFTESGALRPEYIARRTHHRCYRESRERSTTKVRTRNGRT